MKKNFFSIFGKIKIVSDMFDPEKIKEDALKNATLITEEEMCDLSTLTTEEMRNLVLSEFNKLADKIEKEC